MEHFNILEGPVANHDQILNSLSSNVLAIGINRLATLSYYLVIHSYSPRAMHALRSPRASCALHSSHWDMI